MATRTTTPIFIFDNPRTSSQLLNLFFSGHPSLDASPGRISSWIWPLSVGGPERLSTKLIPKSSIALEADRILESEMHAWYTKYVGIDINHMFKYDFAQMGFTQAMQGGEKRKFSREHRTSLLRWEVLEELLMAGNGDIGKEVRNPTYIPDEIFFSISKPVILIRHPALVVPSYFRAQSVKQKYEISDEIFRAWTMQKSARFLYESFVGRGAEVFVVDGDDVMFRSKMLCERLCEIWELEFSGVRFEWEEGSEVEKSFPLSDGYMDVTFGSKGIVAREPKVLDVDVEHERWKKEFGEDVARSMRKLVDDDMDDYEYLKARKLMV